MTDPLPNVHEYSVSELAFALKRSVEDRFGHVRVRGELSGVKIAASGHLYAGLKDEGAVLDVVCWRGQLARMGFRPEDGLEVIATGRLTTYPARSKYQLVIERLEPAGVGALMALLDERRKKLAAEGLFAQERKRPLPFLPDIVAVVTSPTGAVIRDILHRLAERFPRRVLLWPVLVQGEGAAEQVAAAVRGLNELSQAGRLPRPDVIIVARGGGSIEDLWPFNEEAVVRAVAESRIPVISAVGHETDTTLIDHAADRRAPTPTAAAEMAVPVRGELIARLRDLDARLDGAMARLVMRLGDRLKAAAAHLARPRDLLLVPRQRLDELGERLPRALIAGTREKRLRLTRAAAGLVPSRLRQHWRYERRGLDEAAHRLSKALARTLEERRQRLESATRLLESLSYKAVLARGFAVIRRPDGTVVARAERLSYGERVRAEFFDGWRPMRVEADERVSQSSPATPSPNPRAGKSRRAGGEGGGQGRLF
ncbi:MAG: exodeoxyribonuclease VII large subunit [Alphaproteobacteria bacterium]|nr:MAG: exodeoxyribonuclease VII large subunit [Alphaproteobacteria bacterium]